MTNHSVYDTGLYTLTPTHVGTGQASGAIDSPITREQHTGFPFIPASALKGILRDLAEGHRGVPKLDNKVCKKLLGPPPPTDAGSEEQLEAGELVITDARILAFPVRSLQAPFFWVTCKMVIQRWARNRQLMGLNVPPETAAAFNEERVFVSGPKQGSDSLILEDTFYTKDDCNWKHTDLLGIAQSWSRLLPKTEQYSQQELHRKLVCIPDAEFQNLVRKTTPVSARIQLTGGKTTSKWKNPETEEIERGNLWYEETLPSDCLFSVLVTSRNRDNKAPAQFKDLIEHSGAAVIQVGGNETIGQGLCWWTIEEQENGK